jgi:glycosyltransferase 2 family protein
VLVASAAVLVIRGAVVVSPSGRRWLVRPSVEIPRTAVHPASSGPGIQLFGGATAYPLISGLGLAASLAAFGVRLPLLAVLMVFVTAQALGHLTPIPGGLGAFEALMVAGLTAVGIPSAAAVAAVPTSRLLTYWLPALPWIATFRYLQHHDIA